MNSVTNIQAPRVIEITEPVHREPITPAVQPYWPLWIRGAEHSRPDGARFPVYNPSTGEMLCEVARGGPTEVDLAVQAASDALAHWATRPVSDRRQLLFAMARLLQDPKTRDDLALLECLNTGKPLREARDDVTKTAAAFEFYGGLVDKLFGTTIPVSQEMLNYTVREPMGVTAHIAPWNYPLRLAFRSVIPALAGGNTVVLKPAEETPLTALRMAQVFADAGLPPGVFNVVAGYGSDAGAALSSHKGVQHISFTGSVETGMAIMRQAANNVVPVTLELGGKSPFLLFADADLDSAIESLNQAMFANAGQICFAATRVLVQTEVYDEAVRRCVARAQRIRVGPGLADLDMGPLISKQHRDRVLQYIEVGKQEGGAVLTGGKTPADPACGRGYFLEPTLIDGVSNQARICQEEIFGPVVSLQRFSTTDEAIRLANDTPYGLAAGVWTSDINRAHRCAAELKAGQVFINDYFSGTVASPFGGCKRSGFGRERGVEAMQHYQQVKSVFVRIRPEK